MIETRYCGKDGGFPRGERRGDRLRRVGQAPIYECKYQKNIRAAYIEKQEIKEKG